MHKKPKTLLSVDTNAKTVKGQTLGFLTGILYLAPAAQSGHQVCPMAVAAQCERACLYTSGRGAMSSVQIARLNRTRYFFEDRATFMLQIIADIERLVRRAAKLGMTPLVRLNGTSDVRWESIPVTIGDTTHPNIMAAFPDIQFYDYTKLAGRTVPANYDITFSYSGVKEYQQQVAKAIEQGLRIAVVFRHRDKIPTTFNGMNVVDGDDTDIRHLDPQGVVVALYAKGAARKDTTGFVV
jgi:hypothetical protein